MTKKIAHIIIGLNVGGAELMLQRLVLNSSKKDQFEHCVISLTDLGFIGPQLQEHGIKVYSLGMDSLSSLPFILYKLRSLLKEIKPDVVQTWMYHADFLGGIAAKSIGIKNIIWGVRTTDVSQGASKLTVYLSKLCAKLSYLIPNTIVCAAHVSKDYHISIGYDKSKIIVIPNGFDPDAFSATKKEGVEIRRQNNLSETDIVIGSIGRFNPVKNQKLFVELAAELIKDKPNLKFMMIGRDNTIHNKELMSWIRGHNLQKSFRLLGQRSDIPQCLKALDIFCLHSKTEGFPNVIVESILSQTYVVANNVGDVKYLIPSKQVTNPEVIDLKNCILQSIYDNSYKDKLQLSQLSETTIYKYSIDSISLRFEKLYETS